MANSYRIKNLTFPWVDDAPPKVSELRLVAQMSEVPPGFVAWLTVRNHRFSVATHNAHPNGLHWRRGVFLSYREHDALLELRSPELYVNVRGNYPYYFTGIIRDSVEYLISRRWPGLEYKLSVPCPTKHDDDHECKGRFPLPVLEMMLSKGRSMIFCQECLIDHDVSSLVLGFAQPTEPLVEQFASLVSRASTVGPRRLDPQDNLIQLYEKTRRFLLAATNDCPRLFLIRPLDERSATSP